MALKYRLEHDLAGFSSTLKSTCMLPVFHPQLSGATSVLVLTSVGHLSTPSKSLATCIPTLIASPLHVFFRSLLPCVRHRTLGIRRVSLMPWNTATGSSVCRSSRAASGRRCASTTSAPKNSRAPLPRPGPCTATTPSTPPRNMCKRRGALVFLSPLPLPPPRHPAMQ